MTAEQYEIYPAPRPFKVPRKLKIIVIVMLICALAGLAGLVSATGNKKVSPSGSPKYLGYAQLVAQNYVKGHPLNLPVSGSLTNSLGRQSQQTGAGSTTAVAPGGSLSNTIVPLDVSYITFLSGTDSTNSKSGLVIETDYFLIEDSSGNVAQLIVVMNGNGNSKPTLGAAPTLFPGVNGSSGGAVTTGITTQSSQTPLPASVISQVGVWAKAFTSSNHDLYIVTGDTTKRSYKGITGYSLVGTPLIISATPYDSAKPPTSVQLTVQLTLQSTADPTIVTTSEYDLLITSLTNALPDVSAWGPPGSGPSLVIYQNGF